MRSLPQNTESQALLLTQLNGFRLTLEKCSPADGTNAAAEKK
jgi:hypothetical protein